MRKIRSLRSLNQYEIHCFGAAAIAAAGAAASVAGSAISGSMGASAAEGAAGISAEAAQLGINELKAALPPSMQRLAEAQNWSDAHLRKMYHQAMGQTRPYADAGRRGLGRLNYLMGTDNGLGPAPTAPTAPKKPKALKPPTYSKDPKQAAAQKSKYNAAVAAQAKQYRVDLRAYDKAKAEFPGATAAWQASSAAAASDPSFGGMMKPYDDRFEGRIDAVAGRKYEDTHGFGQRILDTAAEKYDDKYANEILGVSRDTFEADDFTTNPGYEFRRSEGNRGVEQSAAARGGLQSGAAQKALVRFNQDTASDEFDRSFGRWSDEHNRHLAGVTGQQGFDYGAWADNKGTRLNALGGERAFDYGAWDKQKDTEMTSLYNRRDYDFNKAMNHRDFQYDALNNMVGVGQEATDDQSRERQLYSTARTQNALGTATRRGTGRWAWQPTSPSSWARRATPRRRGRWEPPMPIAMRSRGQGTRSASWRGITTGGTTGRVDTPRGTAGVGLRRFTTPIPHKEITHADRRQNPPRSNPPRSQRLHQRARRGDEDARAAERQRPRGLQGRAGRSEEQRAVPVWPERPGAGSRQDPVRRSAGGRCRGREEHP